MELQVLYTSGAHYVEPNWRSIDRTLCFYFFVCEKLGKKWTMWLDYAYWVIFFFFIFVYWSVDARGKYMKDAQHWSDRASLHGRAHLRATSDKVRLIFEPVRNSDEGIYKCRVDFKKSPTRYYRTQLTVISRLALNFLSFQRNEIELWLQCALHNSKFICYWLLLISLF